MTHESPTPKLCVVGHPNRGKSSIVSTLTENDQVRIGPESGTTQRADAFEFRLQRELLLTLVDTPGFQRARQLLEWLSAVPVSPGDRPARVRAFLEQPEHHRRFPDEVALLAPIMAGAGILYVVDASQPPSTMDEAEMEILRWTGQPRMAIINPIEAEDYSELWRRTLGQFFQWVRVFNPLSASLSARRALLRAVGELVPDWSRPMQRLIQGLEKRDRQRLADASESLAAYWCEQLVYQQSLGPLSGATGRVQAEARFRAALDDREAAFFRQLRRAWGHQSTEVESQSQWEWEAEQLMNTQVWYLWGLKQRELLWVSGSAGAATGLLVDLGLGGGSLMTGALSGGLIGSVSGWLGSRQLTGKRLGWLPLAREKRYLGPVKHPNFPLVVMARALTFTRQLWLKPHAERSAIALRARAEDWPRQDQVQLLQWARLLQQGRWRVKHQDALINWVRQQLTRSLEKSLAVEESTSWDD